MSKEEREFLDALRAHSIQATAEILEGVHRLKSMYEEATDDGSGTPLPRPRIGDHFYRLAKFELEHASNLIRLGNSQVEMIFDHLRQLARRHQKTSHPVLELVADGKNCKGRFDVRNPFERTADLRFEIAPLRKADGEPSDAKLKVSAKGRAVGVGALESRSIELTVPVPDQPLFGELKVFLVADLEKQVAHRVIKVSPQREGR